MENHRLARAAFFIVLSSILYNASGNKQQTQLQNLEEYVLDLQAECVSIRKDLRLERIERQNMIELLNETLYQCTGDCKGTGVKDKQPHVLKESLGKASDVSDCNDSYYFQVLRRSLQAEKVTRRELENKLADTEHKYSKLVNTVNTLEEKIMRLSKHDYDVVLSKLRDFETKMESKVGVLDKTFAELASKVGNLTRFEDKHSEGSNCHCPDRTVCVKEDDIIISCIEGNACKSNKCANGGTCVASRAEEKCYCLTGTSGDTCQVKDKEFQPFYFIETPESELISTNQHYIRTCRVNIRDAQFRWYHDKTLMTGAPELGMGILDIDNFEQDDEGEYTCVAISGAKHIEHNFKLHLGQTCNLGMYARPEDTSEEMGHKVLLKCYFPLAISYTWFKDGQHLNIQGSSRYKLHSGGYLEIQVLYKTDAGLYTCEGKGESGCTSSFSAVLNVTDSDTYKQICGISAYEDEASVKPFVRISSGMETESRIGPWHVMITDKRTGEVFCGGTLISKSWVVTTAHCILEFQHKYGFRFDRSSVALHLGSNVCGKGAVLRSVMSYKTHERYNNPVTFNNDIAVIKMDESVEYKNTRDIKPICLEPEGEMNRQFFYPAERNISSKTLVFGCGYINTVNNVKATMLQVVEMPIVSRAECTTGTGRGVFTENMICGGSKVANSGDICRGDIGGGWVMRMPRSNRWVLGGIASWGASYHCDVANVYSFYTHVAKFYNWIVLNTNYLADM